MQIVRITVSCGAIASFGLTAGTDTTIHAAGAAYTFGICQSCCWLYFL